MNRTSAKLGIFALALVLIFGVTFFAGRAFGPTSDAAPRDDEPTMESMGPMGDESAGSEHGEGESPESEHGGGHEAETGALPGLAVSAEGYTLVPEGVRYRSGADQVFRFTITGPDGHAVTDFEREHEKELHLIVVRRDLSSFQHLHPTRAADGTWTAKVDLPVGGTYRAYTDFKPTGHDETMTLGVDVSVAGDFAPVKLPAPAIVDRVGDYEVEMKGSPTAGEAADLTFTVTRNGKPVADLEPYLGAFGHLVTIRDGDLAYLHTHPHQEAHAGESGGPQIKFNTTLPSRGTYRLFLNFQTDGRVQTAGFTVAIDDHGHGAPEPSATPTASPTR